MFALRPLIASLGLAAIAWHANAPVAVAHEFWIDAESYKVSVAEPVTANLRVGQDYEGSAFSFLPRSFRRFDLIEQGATRPVEGRLGDIPALTVEVDEGLLVVVHETTDSRLTYTEMSKFADFVLHKDAAWTLDVHTERGFPEDQFREVYSRYAKALIAVGSGAGADQEAGLETEFIALANPYTDLVGGAFPVRLLYRGEPRPDAQVEVFEKMPDGSVTVNFVRTDADGVAQVPVSAGNRYMIDAVVLREPTPDLAEETGAVWESLWANMTFAIPAR
ncbi:MAG: DUF4198 domain-containing protein [Pseudomonadota bacterium]